MRKNLSVVHSELKASRTEAMVFDQADLVNYTKDLDSLCRDLSKIGINLTEYHIQQAIRQTGSMTEKQAMDSLNDGLLPSGLPVPIQFLEKMITGIVFLITRKRTLDNILPILTIADWEDELVFKMAVAPTGTPNYYDDYASFPFASYNNQFTARNIVRFELGFESGILAEARMNRVNLSDADTKRKATALALDILRNNVGFNGFNAGTNNTYGFFNDPTLSAYISATVGASGYTLWSTKTFKEITADIRLMYSTLRKQSGNLIGGLESDENATKATLVIASDVYDYLTTATDFNVSVIDWLKKSYPNTRIVSAVELNKASGNQNVAYLFADEITDDDYSTDDRGSMTQIVPARLKLLGTEKLAKVYREDYSMATAGVLVSRGYAIVRMSGI